MVETELIDLLRNRDPRGAEALLQHYTPLLRYVIAPILSDPRDREDCLSETAMRVWERVDQYDPNRGGWTGWLTAVARNTALDRLRQVKRHSCTDLDGPDTLEPPSPEPDPEEHLLKTERQAALKKALLSLSTSEQTLFYRKYYYMQSTAQIAAELSTTQRAVEGRLYRIKQKLRKLLGGELYG